VIASPPLPPPPPLPAPPRLPARTLLVVLGIAFLAVVLVAGVVVATRGPDDPQGCGASVCRGPGPGPGEPSLENAQPVGTRYVSPELHYSLEYEEGDGSSTDGVWQREASTDRSISLSTTIAGRSATLDVEAVPASEANPAALLDRVLDRVAGSIPTLAPDCVTIAGTGYASACAAHPEHTLLGPNIGYVDGIGGAWAGDSDGTQRSVLIMVASDGRLTIAATFITAVPFKDKDGYWDSLTGSADTVLNTVRWPTGGGACGAPGSSSPWRSSPVCRDRCGSAGPTAGRPSARSSTTSVRPRRRSRSRSRCSCRCATARSTGSSPGRPTPPRGPTGGRSPLRRWEHGSARAIGACSTTLWPTSASR
jgi:hypothetical protein